MAHLSLRDELVFCIGYAIGRSRDLLREILKQHVSDGPRQPSPRYPEIPISGERGDG